MSFPRKWAGLIIALLAVSITFCASQIPHLKTIPLLESWLGMELVKLGVDHLLLELLVRKSGHVLIFACLGLGLRLMRLPWGWLLFLGLFWGVLDEFHQTFTSGREGSVLDVLIDFVGVLLGAGLGTGLLRWPKH